MNKRRAHIVIPAELIAEIDTVVGKRCRSQFMTEAVRKELKRLRFKQSLDEAVGAWKDKDHPELNQGSASWVTQLRGAEEARTLKSNISE